MIHSIYFTEIYRLSLHKSKKVRRYAKIASLFFKISNHYKHKAEMIALSGGEPQKFQKKVKKTLGSLSEIQRNTFPVTVTGNPEHLKELTEPKSSTYEEAKKNREKIQLVPAKPGFFKMTEDVPKEKREELEKEIVVQQKNEPPLNEEERKRKAQARKFYYKRKRKKFDPQKFNQQKKEN